jgi:hypothetical protein
MEEKAEKEYGYGVSVDQDGDGLGLYVDRDLDEEEFERATRTHMLMHSMELVAVPVTYRGERRVVLAGVADDENIVPLLLVLTNEMTEEMEPIDGGIQKGSQNDEGEGSAAPEGGDEGGGHVHDSSEAGGYPDSGPGGLLPDGQGR